MKKLLLVLGFLLSGLSNAQENATEKTGIKRAYFGMVAGSDFEDFHSSVNLRIVFWKAPVFYLDYMNRYMEPSDMPDDYYGDAVFPHDPAKDFLKTYSIMGGREFRLSHNIHVLAVGGLNMTKLYEVAFTTREDNGFFESNYRKTWEETNVTGGFTAKGALTWEATSWLGLGLELVGNLNNISNYGAVNFGVYIGLMGKEK